MNNILSGAYQHFNQRLKERFDIQMGVPQMSDNLQDAKIFTYDEALSKMGMICFGARMIEI